MNIVLLSGGSGKRLWPLSNEIRSKQFIKFMKLEDGSSESMIQRVYKQIKRVDRDANIVVATSSSQVPLIENQLNGAVNISIEPMRKDTFPAISLASAYLTDVLKISEDEAVVFCPVDPFCDDLFFEGVKSLYKHVLTCESNISLIGIKPSFPSSNYGYIIPERDGLICPVKAFAEKPSTEQAKEFIARGALWNAGVFGFKLKYILGLSEDLLGFRRYRDLFENYSKFKSISFDYAVVEKEKRIEVIKYSGMWRDIGTWGSLTKIMTDNVVGKGIIAENCQNVSIINELGIPVLGLGLNNVVIAASPDGILVSDKTKDDGLKMLVDQFGGRPMYEERVWGTYRVLEHNTNIAGNNSLVKHLVIKEGKHISYQKHQYRSEMWTIVEGSGEVVLNGSIRKVSKGDYVFIQENNYHAIRALTDLHIIEVQMGTLLCEEDIERFDWNWDVNN